MVYPLQHPLEIFVSAWIQSIHVSGYKSILVDGTSGSEIAVYFIHSLLNGEARAHFMQLIQHYIDGLHA